MSKLLYTVICVALMATLVPISPIALILLFIFIYYVEALHNYVFDYIFTKRNFQFFKLVIKLNNGK